MNEETLQCRICGSSRLRRKPFGYRFNGKWLQGMECGNCGVIFIHPQPTSEEISRMYSKEYFYGDFRCGHGGSYFDEAALSRLVDRSLLERIKRYKPHGKLLEIGCAGGAFLNAARGAGYQVWGVEFSEAAAQFARRRFALEVTTGEITQAGFPDTMFDVVFMGDVLEHLPNPLATLREINRVTIPGGTLVLACPMQTNTLFSRSGFLVYRALRRNAIVNLPPYHLFEYRPKSLMFLLRRCGFEITYREESMIHPKEIALRGTPLQRIGKKVFQYPNYFLSRTLGILGDRLEVFATKRTRLTTSLTRTDDSSGLMTG